MTTSNILFIDSQVMDYETLVASLPADTQWFLIDSDSDAISQMLAVLEGFSDLASIQIVSHGSEGSLLLGGSLLDAVALQGYSEQLAQLGSYLSEGGDLLLYGCDVAGGEAGETFIELLASLTGADVAASTDTTGLGGDWELEASTGSIEAQVLEAAAYTASLDVINGTETSETLNGTSGDDTIYGNGGGDTIIDSAGSNYVDGGAGADYLRVLSTTGNQTLLGGAGSDDDRIIGMGQTVSMDGGDGNDILQAFASLFDTVDGANKSVTGMESTIIGGLGNDTIEGASQLSILIQADEGADQITVTNSHQVTVTGGSGADTINSSFNTSTNSNIGASHGGTQVLDGGDDDDSITLSGQASIYGGLVNATLSGGAGNDRLTLTETVTSTSAATGGVYTALLEGGDGNDTLSASGVMALTLTGGAGSDTFVLTAQQAQTLNAGSRIFELTSSRDTVTVTPEATLITDFTAGAGGDVLDISSLLSLTSWNSENPFDAGFLLLIQSGADILIMLDVDGSGSTEPYLVASLSNVLIDNLEASNFAPSYPPSAAVIQGDLIEGTAGAEVLSGGIGDDTILGLGGDDTLTGNIGNDSIDGGDGNDIIDGEYGNDSLYGGAGDDVIDDNYGSNLIDGGDGNDRLTAQNVLGTQSLLGGAGMDTITGSAQSLFIDGGDDYDTINANGRIQLSGGNYNYIQHGSATLSGGATGADDITADYWANLQVTADDEGSFVTVSNSSNVTVTGGTANDYIYYNYNGSTSALIGESLGATASLSGAGSADVITAQGTAALGGGLITLSLDGGDGNDSLTITETSTATITTTSGGVYSATLSGGAGSDTLTGSGVLQLTMTGGTENDTFTITPQQYRTIAQGDRTFTTSTGVTTVTPQAVLITDFTPGAGGDVLDIMDLMTVVASSWDQVSNPFSQGYLTLTQDGNDTLISFDPDGGADNLVTIARLSNVGFSQLTSSNLNPPFQAVLNNNPVSGTLVISGTASQGQTLTAVANLTDADDLGTFSYEWFANSEFISGATSDSLELTQSHVGKAITVKISYTDGAGNYESITSAATSDVANVNDVPQGNVLISGTPTEGERLTATSTLTDLDGIGAFSYKWVADGIELTGENGSSLVLTQAHVGKAISVVISYTDLGGTNETVTSTQTEPVANINNTPTGSVTIQGENTLGSTLGFTQNIADADGLGTFSYQWQANGVDINGATGTSYTLTQAEVDKTITLTISYTDGFGNAESVTSNATLAVTDSNSAPTGSVVITGTATQGETLSASNTLADGDGLGLISYQWFADGTAINGATGEEYTLTQNEVGKTISVMASYKDHGGTDESLSSAVTSTVANINDAPTGTLTILGNATQGSTLTIASSVTDADGIPGLNYQWLAGGIAIEGATGTSLLLTQDMVGMQIQVTATYTDDFGQAESVSSAVSPSVKNINDLPLGGVFIAGTQATGQVLTASNTLTDADGIATAISYQWYAGNMAIDGATATTLTVTADIADAHISVVASYTDGYGMQESYSSDDEPTESGNNAPTGSLTISGSLEEDATLTLTQTLQDADGIASDITYQWLADGQAIEGATGTTLLLVQELVGKAISVRASYTDGVDKKESFVSAATLPIANDPDPLTGEVVLEGIAEQGQTLFANTSALADDDGIASIDYVWFAAGEEIIGVTGASLELSQDQVGKAIHVEVTVTDEWGASETRTTAATSAVTNVNDSPEGELLVSGAFMDGQMLTVDTSKVVDADGLGNFSYQWFSNGSAITGATGQTYALTEAHIGQEFSVQISYTDQFGAQETLSSTPELVIAYADYPVTGTPVISGSAIQGVTLRADTTGLVDGNGIAELQYQWYANGTAIANANESSLLLTQAQVGQTIRLDVTVIDDTGSSEVVSSQATSAVGDTNDAPEGGVALSGNAVEGQVLTADTSALTDADGLGTLAYQWLINGSAIQGATGSSYTVSASDIGHQISVRISYVDNGGFPNSLTSDAATISSLANWQVMLTDQDDSYIGTAEADRIFALAGNDYVQGMAGDDTIDGGDGNDTIDGGAGNDSMIGGLGNDAFYVDSINDVVVENSNAGTDTVFSSITLTLANNVEQLYLLGSDSIRAYGNSANNLLRGNSGNNWLNGGAGADTMSGGDGNDYYYIDNVGDRVVEVSATGGTDIVFTTVNFFMRDNVERLYLEGTGNIRGYGNSGNNSIKGNSGNNWLDGGAGADILAGGAGNDYYFIDNTSDRAIETSASGGTDIVFTTVNFFMRDYIEQLYLQGTGNIRGYGNSQNNLIKGNSGNNWLNGGAGADTLAGGNGNDYYFVDSSADRVVEVSSSGGTDTVFTTATFILRNYVENMYMMGTGNIRGYGNSQNNLIKGNSGNNWLDGGAGADTLVGGNGNDYYFVDNAGDRVLEVSSSGGTDVVYSSVTFVLGNYVENLYLQGSSNIRGYGNTLNNQITGNSGNNVLDGGAGADTLSGGSGNDTLVGGSGRDVMTGGNGIDYFMFNALTDTSASASSADVILDFTTGVDKLYLAGIDANTALSGDQAFTGLISSSASFTAAGQLKLLNGVLYGNTDADSSAEFAIALSGVTSLSNSDIAL